MNNKIFIGGLSYNTTEKMLLNKLQEYGQVTSLRIIIDKLGNSKGYGFATFKNSEDAVKAINEMNNKVFDDRVVGVKEALDKR